MNILNDLSNLLSETGFLALDWKMFVMWAVVGILLYLAVAKNFEPLLLVPISFGALLANLPTQGVVNNPAGIVRAPCDGQVLYVAKKGDDIKLPKVFKEHPIYLERLSKEEAAELFANYASDEKSTLIAIVRPSKHNEALVEEETLTPNKDGASWSGLEVSLYGKDQKVIINSTDELVWANAEGDVISAIGEGAVLMEGEKIVEMYSSHVGGLFYYLSFGIIFEIFPPIIFLGVGAMTDFGPLIANPKTLLLGAAAQFGVFATFIGAIALGFSEQAAAAIGIIGGADGPTSIFLANKLAPDLLAPIAVAAYSYMSLVPVIQPPIMRLCTTEKERKIKMKSLRKVGKLEKLIFAILVTGFCILLVPGASALIGMLMLGNFIKECGVTERLSKTAQNELINIVTIFLGTCVGITMTADKFIKQETLFILSLGIVAFCVATASGIFMSKFMNLFSKEKMNPLIGSAGVSAVPMAARVSQVEGQKADPTNFLLMHAMGPNVAGVIGTAMVAGYFIATLAGK